MSRPDICAGMKIFSEVLDNPSQKHIDALHWMLRYLAGTRNYGITYLGHKDPRRSQPQASVRLHGYYDADWARDVHDRKSRSGYVFLMAGEQSAGGVGSKMWWQLLPHRLNILAKMLQPES